MLLSLEDRIRVLESTVQVLANALLAEPATQIDYLKLVTERQMDVVAAILEERKPESKP